MSDVLVSVDNVSKKFCLSLKKSLWYGVKDMASEMYGRGGERELRTDEFWAVKDVSFELKRGECLGLIGRNGAGKTTLLRMLNGLIKPDSGRIEIRGRVGALIALGAGFNPILTGRENISINASVLGLSKREIDAKLDEIIDFADITEFIDSPVQNYSSGMVVRLGFSIATVLEPDVLLLDEVLAVGDAAFRNKCYRRIATMRKKSAVIFVTHNMDQVARICDRALVLTQGVVCGIGSSADGISLYESLNQQGDSSEESFLSCEPPLACLELELDESPIQSGSDFQFKIKLIAEATVPKFVLRVTVYNSAGDFAADCNFESKNLSIEIKPGLNVWRLVFPGLPLKRGRYKISINVIDPFGAMLIWSHKQIQLQVVGGYGGAISDCQLQGQCQQIEA